MVTENRKKRIEDVLSKRQGDLIVVLENIRNIHNINAIIRTIEGMGIQNLIVVNEYMEPLSINEAISTKADKWITIKQEFEIEPVLKELKENGFSIYTTSLGENTEEVYNVDYSKKVSIVFGNEKEGVSDKVLKYSDKLIKIPMRGMVKSFNVSVSVGIILYEAIRQREISGYIKKGGLATREKQELFLKWTSGNRVKE